MVDERALDKAWAIFGMRRNELKKCPTCQGSGFGLNRCHCWMCKKTGSIRANTVEDSFTHAIEAYEAAKWRPIHEIPIMPNTEPKPLYFMLFNGWHAGVGYVRLADDGDDTLEFWSETGEPIEPKPTMFRTIDPPKQDAVSRGTSTPPAAEASS